MCLSNRGVVSRGERSFGTARSLLLHTARKEERSSDGGKGRLKTGVNGSIAKLSADMASNVVNTCVCAHVINIHVLQRKRDAICLTRRPFHGRHN